MDTMILKMLEGAPTFVGLVVAVFILYRQNERLMSELFERLDLLDRRVSSLETRVVSPYPADARPALFVTQLGSDLLKGGQDGSVQS